MCGRLRMWNGGLRGGGVWLWERRSGLRSKSFFNVLEVGDRCLGYVKEMNGCANLLVGGRMLLGGLW